MECVEGGLRSIQYLLLLVKVYAVVPPFFQPSFLFFPSHLSISFCFLFPVTTTLAEGLVISLMGGFKGCLNGYSLSCPFLPLNALHTSSEASVKAQTWSCMSLSSWWAFWGPHWQLSEGQTWLVLKTLNQPSWGTRPTLCPSPRV